MAPPVGVRTVAELRVRRPNAADWLTERPRAFKIFQRPMRNLYIMPAALDINPPFASPASSRRRPGTHDLQCGAVKIVDPGPSQAFAGDDTLRTDGHS